ncbi:MAG: hypothetical protein Q4E53_12385 [Eubacteriales bacterium]|nr:hypothetical protein [Eubacteriales bacterium]
MMNNGIIEKRNELNNRDLNKVVGGNNEMNLCNAPNLNQKDNGVIIITTNYNLDEGEAQLPPQECGGVIIIP